MRNLKRVIAGLVTVAILTALGATSVFGATASVTKGMTNSDNSGYYTATSEKTASWKATTKQRKSAKTVTIGKTVTINGKKLKVTSIGSKALKGIKKLKTIKIKANIVAIHKNAFKGVSKKKLAKIVVKFKKGSVSKSTFKKLKKQLIKKGFKAKNIKWY